MTTSKITEFAVVAGATYILLLQDRDLDNIGDAADEGPFHLYFIARRPRVSVAPECFRFSDDHVEGRFLVQRGPNHVPYDFRHEHPAAGRATALQSEWPHTAYILVDAVGQVMFETSAALAAPFIHDTIADALALEVLYIGQSYGSGGERSAEERLQQHATLQRILGETSRRSPDSEIWLLLAKIDAYLLSHIDGKTMNALGVKPDDEAARIASMQEHRFSERQLIAFAEAAFIRHFQPPFNKMFRTLFPDARHSTYSEYFRLDINSVRVEIETDAIGVQLFSMAQPKRWVHGASFALHDSQARRALLHELLPGNGAG